MDNNIVHHVLGQEHELVVEVKIPLLATAAPTRLVIFDKYFLNGHLVVLVVLQNARLH